MKRVLSFILVCILLCPALSVFAGATEPDGKLLYSAVGGTLSSYEELHRGVVKTSIKTGPEYGSYSMNILTVDLENASDVYLAATGAGQYANSSDYVNSILESYDNSHPAQTAVAAVNADLWMMVPHTRTGPYTYGGVTYEDAVMKKSVSLPRGFVVYDGELITSQYMTTETPYQGEFFSFGVTDTNKPLIGCPEIDIKVNGSIKADGLNRLPANNSLVVYTDKGCLNNYALDDAYELLIDAGDYKVKDGAVITGTVEGIYTQFDSENPEMSEGKIILTARGDAVKKINKIKKGAEVSLSFSVYEKYGRNEADWKNVVSAVGGHSPFVIDGVKREISIESGYPSTIVGIKNDGSVLLATIDTGIDGKRGGISGNKYWRLADDLDLNSAILLDGGGSATMAVNYGGEYKIVNNPTDASGPRKVINALVVSYGADRGRGEDAGLRFPYENTDLTQVYLDTKEGRAIIGNQSESLSEYCDDGVKFSAHALVNGSPTFTLSYGLPLTEHNNPDSALAGSEYPVLNADEYKYILLEMKSGRELTSNLQVNYFSAGANYAPSADSFKFNFINNDGGFNTYIMDMSDMPAWKGQIHTLRFSYIIEAAANGTTVSEGDSVTVRSVKLARTAAQAKEMAADNRRADAFTDLDKKSWYYPAARYNIVNKNIYGMTDTTFAPSAVLTRAMFVTMLGRIEGIDPADYPGGYFSDVKEGAWMAPYVNWAYENDIVSGYGNGRFGPSDNITREQMAQIIKSYAAYKKYDVSYDISVLDKFTDKNKISSWATGAIAFCNGHGIINGKSPVTVCPRDFTTRAEASQLLYVFLLNMQYGRFKKA